MKTKDWIKQEIERKDGNMIDAIHAKIDFCETIWQFGITQIPYNTTRAVSFVNVSFISKNFNYSKWSK